LRIAVYQIAYMRVPEWAAVNEAVDVEKAQRGKASLVNAVLRNFLRRRESISPPGDDIALVTSHPGWLIKRWVKRFGPDGALRLAKKNNEIPKLTLRIDDAPARERAVSVFAAKGVQVHKTLYSPSGLVLEDLHLFSDLQA